MVKSIQIHGRLMDFSRPRVMAIVNLSADSFYTSFGVSDQEKLLRSVESMLSAGADIIDLGACSTRPNSQPVSAEEEWQLLAQGLGIIRSHWSDIAISVDTFRAGVADLAIEHGADMINDVYGGDADPGMWDIVAKHRVPYVLTHAQSIPCAQNTYDATVASVLDYLQDRLTTLHRRGIKDVVVDPGFGFGKNTEQNYALLRQLHVLNTLHAPLLVGVSRKSMLYRPLQLTPQEVLPATTAAHVIALQQGANILRVHDVQAAQQAIKIVELTS